MTGENERISQIVADIHDIQSDLSRINLKVHNQYNRTELDSIRSKISEKLAEAEKYYEEFFPVDKEGKDPDWKKNNNIYGEIEKCFQTIRALESCNTSDEEELDDIREKIDGQHLELYKLYGELVYSFATARVETKNLVTRFKGNENVAMILLCKNVRIMEDVINKICVNNIDKSIISGEQQFDSMRYGFEWLFCHEDINVVDTADGKERKGLDLRDTTRYLDYIKYQIMVASKYVKSSFRGSEEIDKLFGDIQKIFEQEEKFTYEQKQEAIDDFKKKTKDLISNFFRIYELLVTYRSLRFREEEIRRVVSDSEDKNDREYVENLDNASLINLQITNLSSVAVRVLLDRFVSFVKINDLNFGNSTFKCAWFNYSELSKSNYAGSDFKYARIENARMKDCDLSTCNITRADGGSSDFSGSNFAYSNLCGINLISSILNDCELQNVAFTDSNIGGYKNAFSNLMGKMTASAEWKRANALYNIWKNSEYSLTTTNAGLDVLLELIRNLNIEPIMPEDYIGLPGTEVLRYTLPGDTTPNVDFTCDALSRQFMSKYISTELIAFLHKKMLREQKSIRDNRITKNGKVYLDAAILNGVSAKNAQMKDLLFNRVPMNRAAFDNTDMSGGIMYYNTANSSSFMFSNLNIVECFESDFYLASFSNAVVNNSVFACCNLEHTNWNKAILISTTFVDLSYYVDKFFRTAQNKIQTMGFKLVVNDNNDDMADECLIAPFWQKSCTLNNASFKEALADRTVFVSIFADRATFSGASMKNAFLFNCRADLADFIETDLRYSILAFSQLTQSNFTKANLTMTNLRHVDFSNSNLRNALFNLSTINRCLFENANTREMNFSGATIKNSVFSGCKFENTIMTNASFENCLFSNVDFTDLIGFHTSKFTNCFYDNCTFKRGRRKAQLINEKGSLRELAVEY